MGNAIQSIQPTALKYLQEQHGNGGTPSPTPKDGAVPGLVDPMVTATQLKAASQVAGSGATATSGASKTNLFDALFHLNKQNPEVAANPTQLIDGIVGTPTTPPCGDKEGGDRIKAYIKAHPEQKKSVVAALADRYWKTCAADPKHRPALSGAIREAGLTKETGAAIDALAKKYPNDPNLNAQFDADGNQTTLSASQQLEGKDLPSIFAEKNDFRDALNVLGNPATQSLLDRLGAQGDPTKSNDGVYGKPALETLANMKVDDPRWISPSKTDTLPVAQRQAAIDAAKKAVDRKDSHFLGEVNGGDGQFKTGDMKAWVENYDKHSVFADGKIETFRQGGIGDCYLLSSMNALAHTKQGREIMEQSMTYSNDTYSIQFAGDPNKQVFKVTKAQVELASAARGASSGDPDVVAMELAADQCAKLHGGTIKEGGWPAEAMHLLSGKDNIHKVDGSDHAELSSTLDAAAADPDGFAITLCSSVKDGKPVPFGFEGAKGGHAFAITGIDPKTQTVTIENPWFTDQPFTMTYKQLEDMSANGGTLINQAGGKNQPNRQSLADLLSGK